MSHEDHYADGVELGKAMMADPNMAVCLLAASADRSNHLTDVGCLAYFGVANFEAVAEGVLAAVAEVAGRGAMALLDGGDGQGFGAMEPLALPEPEPDPDDRWTLTPEGMDALDTADACEALADLAVELNAN